MEITYSEISDRIDAIRRKKGIRDAYDARNWMPQFRKNP